MTRKIWLVFVLGLAFVACDDSVTTQDGSDDSTQDTTAPTVIFDELSAYEVLSGSRTLNPQVSDDGGVALVELRVDGVVSASVDQEPFQLIWDTTKTTDGLHNVSLKATDATGNTTELFPVRVAVINDGLVPVLENNGVGEWDIPSDYDGTQEVDIKHHWTNDEAYAKAIGVITWEVPDGQGEWDVELAMGEGTCPHSGVVYDDGFYSTSGAVEGEVIPTAGWPAATQFFIHGKPMNPMEHKGDTISYRMYVFLFDKAEAEDTETAEQTTDNLDFTGCPLNSGYPCRCDGVAECEDGAVCVAFSEGVNTGLCSASCTGEEDVESCSETLGFGLFGYCGAGKDPLSPEHCIVVCEDLGETAQCPPGFACNAGNGVCLPV